MKIAVIGLGRMGALVAQRLPQSVEKLLIDRDPERAEAAAGQFGGTAAAPAGAAEADVLLFVLPAEATADAVAEAAAIVKPGALLVNMATNGAIPPGLAEGRPDASFVEAKIIGHAGAMRAGAQGIVVAGVGDGAVLDTLRFLLSGLGRVEPGDPALVPLVNTVGSSEGIRAAVGCRKQLAALRVPEEWADTVISVVCAGTMAAYVADDLGGFARALADRLEAGQD